jgi:exosome complex exonuclease RRP6
MSISFHLSSNLTPQQKVATHKGALDPAIHHASQLPKPQLLFKRKVDNSDTLWYPSLTHKYNALVSLGHVYADAGEDLTVMYSAFTRFPFFALMNNLADPTIHTATRSTT